MALRKRIAGVLIAAAVLALVAAGCGGGSSSKEESGSSDTTASESSGSEPSAEFVGKGENGKLATQGKEAGTAEREEASGVIEENFKAREAGDWATQCSTLAAEVIKQIEGSGLFLGATGKGCVKALEAQAKPVPASERVNTMSGPIDVLRVNLSQGFAFYHGTKGKDYVMPLVKEGGEWKLASLKEQEVP